MHPASLGEEIEDMYISSLLSVTADPRQTHSKDQEYFDLDCTNELSEFLPGSEEYLEYLEILGMRKQFWSLLHALTCSLDY